MNTRAPELSALIIIFRSTGPVISTRRSARSTGAAATRNSSGAPTNTGGDATRSRRAASNRLALRPELALQAVDEGERVGRKRFERRRHAG